MNLEDWLTVVNQLPDYAWITLTGGEPLVFKDFKVLFREITKKFPCNIISNGLMLTEDIIEELLGVKNFKVLSISVDSLGNSVRGIKESKWNDVCKLLQHFSNRKHQIRSETILDTKTVVLDENIPHLFEIYRHCVEDLRTDTHSFQLLKGASIQHADTMYDFTAIDDFYSAHVYRDLDALYGQLEKVREYNLENNRKSYIHPKIADLTAQTSIYDYDLEFINREHHEAANFRPCKAPWESVHINVDGNVFPCMAVSMGNIKQTPLEEIVNGRQFSEFKKLIKKCGSLKGCNRCGYLKPKSHLMPNPEILKSLF